MEGRASAKGHEQHGRNTLCPKHGEEDLSSDCAALASQFTCCVILEKSLGLSEHQFPHLKNGGNYINIAFIGTPGMHI